MTESITFTFDGAALTARPGQSLAAALTDAGERVFRHTAKGSPRGIFCGMGVCQDCLVTVDGQPNQRACMTAVRAGAEVRRQVPRPDLRGADMDAGAGSAAVHSVPKARDLSPDVLVIGGGAGGLAAAAVAARAGARVLVLDERKVGGGQYFKQPADALPLLDAQQSEGAALLQEARDAGAELLSGVEIWGAFAGPQIYAMSAEGAPLLLRPRQLIVATGAYERPRMVPGWTLPGVMTTGAAQTLWRSYRSLPGQRVAVCGSGPLNLQVALELARGGADVRLVADSAPSPLRRPLASAALLAADPVLALKGSAMLMQLRRAGVPVRHSTELDRVEENPEGGLLAVFAGARGEESVALDALCMNDGFEPQNDILRLLGADMRYDPTFGHLRCLRSDTLATSVPDVYAVGDCCGLGGAPAAVAEGRLAGGAAAEACGFSSALDRSGAQRRLDRARRFQKRLWALYRAAPRDLDSASDDTLLCRCEEVSLGQFRAAMADGADHIGTVKRATRVGMGCCQGRYCGPAAARVLATSTGRSLSDHSYFAPRVPVKPVSIGALLATREALDGGDAHGQA
jgi:NADPH-dependent 2,4-dienoyl-CoA reductase/sulfur reductase-like enzyme